MSDSLSDQQRQLAVTIMTTEQFTLQTARGVTTSESTGRATLYLGTLSSALVALGFVAQVSEFGRSFSIFALLILPPIVFLGLITFQRAVQSMMEDAIYMKGMVRIRHLYVELVPATKPYFVLPTEESLDGPVPIGQGTWQAFLTIGAAIGVVNSVMTGAIVGLAVNLIFTPPLTVSTGAGIAVAIASVVSHYRYQVRKWNLVDQTLDGPAASTDDGAPA